MPKTIKDEVVVPRTCSNCNRVGHRATTCKSTTPNPIKLVGVEIEGYWENLRAAQEKAISVTGKRGCSDGSLRGASGYSGWEFQTEPNTIGSAIGQTMGVYPDYVSEDCGMHVHMSFHDTLDVTSLMTEEFFRYIVEKLKAWGTEMNINRDSNFWSRVDGNNQYCRPNVLLAARDGKRPNLIDEDERYRVVNFTAWREHRTVEFRVLPMFQQNKIAASAIRALTDAVDEWICGPGRALIDTLAPGAVTLGEDVLSGNYEWSWDIDLLEPINHEILLPPMNLVDVEDLGPVADGMVRVPRAELAATISGMIGPDVAW